MRYFKICMIVLGCVFAMVGATAGILYLTGAFNKKVVQPENIAFEITDVLTEEDFTAKIFTTTENVTEKTITLSLTNQTENDGYITDGIITVPKTVEIGETFNVKVNKTHYEGIEEEWNVGGKSTLRARSANPLIQEAVPMQVTVDVPVHSVMVELYSLSGNLLGEVSTTKNAGHIKTLAAEGEGDNTEQEEKKIVELAVGSVINLKAKFLPEKSKFNSNGELKTVLFEIPKAWEGRYLDFYDQTNTSIQILKQTTVQDIKINCYCFKNSKDEYAALQGHYSSDGLIDLLGRIGIKGESAQIFGTNQKISNFESDKNEDYIILDINQPKTLFANNVDFGNNEFDLGLKIQSDAGDAKLEDKIGVIKLYAYRKNNLGEWVDAGSSLVVEGKGLSTKVGNGVLAKINKSNADLSCWRLIASESGIFKIDVVLEYEYYSSNSEIPTNLKFDVEYPNIVVNDPIESEVSWDSSMPVIQTLTILDGEEEGQRHYPTIKLSDYVKIHNLSSTYKVVKYFVYTDDPEVDLTEIINCVPYGNIDSHNVYEIKNGILTAKDIGSFKVYFSIVASDYLGNVTLQDGKYIEISTSINTNTINVVKSLKTLDASIEVNPHPEEEKNYNQNTDEATKDYIFFVRQQDNNVFTLTLTVSDVDIFERDYLDGKIHINFLDNGEINNVLSVSEEYEINHDDNTIKFQINVGSLNNYNYEPTLDCFISYDTDSRLNLYAKNDILGEKQQVKIKVLNGYVQYIGFDIVANAIPQNSLENPILVNIDFNVSADNYATSIIYSLLFNGEPLNLENLSKVTINEEALNKTYRLNSNKPGVVAVVEDSDTGEQTLSILGSTQDEIVIITATASDGSNISANLYLKILASKQIVFTPNESEITIDGYQGNQINFRSYYSATAGEIDLKNLLTYELLISDNSLENSGKISFADDTLKILSTFGKDASLQLYIKTNFGLTKIVPIRIVGDIEASSNYSLNDFGLNDSDFLARGEQIPSNIGTRVYAENERDITFNLTQKSHPGVAIGVSVDDFIVPNGANINFSAGVLKVSFDPVSETTEKVIIFKKNFTGGDDDFGFVYTMRFVVFPNIKMGYSQGGLNALGSETNPVEYRFGKTILFDPNPVNYSNGLIKLERILGEKQISENVVVQAKLGEDWQTLSTVEGKILIPEIQVGQGGKLEVRIIYEGYILNPIEIFMTPYFGETLPTQYVLYDGVKYIPFVANGEGFGFIELPAHEGVSYEIIRGSNENWLKLTNTTPQRIETVEKKYIKIISSEKLRVTNQNGYIDLPILILPIDYPFVQYDELPSSKDEITHDLKYIIEEMYDVIESGEDGSIDLNSKITYTGIRTINITNQDGSNNDYITYDYATGKITANPVGGDEKVVLIEVKCGAEFEDAFSFVYRLHIIANQSIGVFYPYKVIKEDEEYNTDEAYEYLYFDEKSQISVDLLEKFDINLPIYSKLSELYGEDYARRFVIYKTTDDENIPLKIDQLRFEIASVVVGGFRVPYEQVGDYVMINQQISSDNKLENANLIINKIGGDENIYIVTIKAYTLNGASAYYKFRIASNRDSYKVYYDKNLITNDNFKFATDGGASVNLQEKVVVKINKNPESTLADNAYDFYMLINMKDYEDYNQIVSLDGRTINVKTLVNNVETIIVIFDERGEISRFNLTLKATIDHDVRNVTIGDNGIYDVSSNVYFFDSAKSENDYSMEEVKVELFANSYLHGQEVTDTDETDKYKYLGEYQIEDNSVEFYQYVVIDGLKCYANDLFELYNASIEERSFEVYEDVDEKHYILYNGLVIYIDEESYISIPIGNGNSVNLEVEIIDDKIFFNTLRFELGGDGRDFVVYSVDEESGNIIEPDMTKPNTNKYVTVLVGGVWTRYRLYNVGSEYVAKILFINHNDQTMYAKIDADDFDHEYVEINGERYYFVRFYKITYSGLAEDSEETEEHNVPTIRYIVNSEEFDNEGNVVISLSNILKFGEDDENNKLTSFQPNKNKMWSEAFKFELDGEELEVYHYEETAQEEIEESNINDGDVVFKVNKTAVGTKNAIKSLVIYDITGNFVVGRVYISITVETKTSASDYNKNVEIEADKEIVNYYVSGQHISLEQWKNLINAVNENEKIETKEYAVSCADGGASIIATTGKITYTGEPWVKVTPEAYLVYSYELNQTTKLSYEYWRDALGLGEITYDELIERVVVRATLGDTVINSFDEYGNLIDLGYGEEDVKISLGKYIPTTQTKVDGGDPSYSNYEFVELGDEYTFTTITGTSTNYDADSLEEVNTILQHNGLDEISLEDIYNHYYLYDDDGRIILEIWSDDINKNEVEEGAFEYSLSEFGKIYGKTYSYESEPEIKTLSGEVYLIKQAEDELGTYVDDVDTRIFTINLPETYIEETLEIDGGYEIQEISGNQAKVVTALDMYVEYISYSYNYKTLLSYTNSSANLTTDTISYKELFNILADKNSWEEGNYVCDTEIIYDGVNKYIDLSDIDLSEVSLFINDERITDISSEFAGKEFRFEIKSKDLVEGRYFYIVNKEKDNRKIHYKGNINQIADFEVLEIADIDNGDNEITSLHEIQISGEKYYVIPLETIKTYNIKANWFDITDENQKFNKTIYPVENEIYELTDTTYNFEMYKYENEEYKLIEDGELTLNAGLFNTFYIYQNGYPIGNINIYLKDFDDDNGFNKRTINGATYIYVNGKLSINGVEHELTDGSHTDAEGITYTVKDGALTIIAAFNNNTVEIDDVTYTYISENNSEKLKIGNNEPQNLTDGSYADAESGITYTVKDGKLFISTEKLLGKDKSPTWKGKDNSVYEDGGVIYKAEKSQKYVGDEANIVYKDLITEDSHNYENWEYNIYYVDNNGVKHYNNNDLPQIEISDYYTMELKPTIHVEITGITNIDGEAIEGGYKFDINLDKQNKFIVSGGAEIPDFDSDKSEELYSGEETTVNVISRESDNNPIFMDSSESIKLKDVENSAKSLFENGYYSYLMATQTMYSIKNYTFTYDKKEGKCFVKFGEIPYLVELDNGEFVVSYVNNEEKIIEKTINIELSDIYNFEKNGDYLVITPKYNFELEVIENASILDIVKTDNTITVTAKTVKSTTTATIKFKALRGDLVVATAYYFITVKPSATVEINYPSISGTKNVQEDSQAYQQTEERVYFGDGYTLDLSKPSELNKVPDEEISSPRVLIKENFGIYTLNGVTYTYNEGALKIGNNEPKNLTDGPYTDAEGITYTVKDGALTISKALNVENKATINEVAYTYNEGTLKIGDNEPQNLTDGSYTDEESGIKYMVKDSTLFICITNIEYSLHSGELSVLEINGTEVSLKEGATITSEITEYIDIKYNGDIIGQYKLVICPEPIVKMITNIEETHIEDGVELIPYSGEVVQLFTGDRSNIIQFAYKDIVLDSSYYSNFGLNGQSVSSFETENEIKFKFFNDTYNIGTYKYKTVWDYKINAGEGDSPLSKEPVENSEDYIYIIKAGTSYKVSDLLNITHYFNSDKVEPYSVVSDDAQPYADISKKDGDWFIDFNGASNSGNDITITIQVYEGSNAEEFNIRILPNVEFIIDRNYTEPTTYKNSEEYYQLIDSGSDIDIASYVQVEIDGNISEDNKSNLTYNLDSQFTDGSLGAQLTTPGYKLTISKTPQFDRKPIVINVRDAYGYTGTIRLLVKAEHQVEIVNDYLEFKTGQDILWDGENILPVVFHGEDGISLLQVSTYKSKNAIDDNKLETTLGSPEYSGSSVKIGTDNILYGVQINDYIKVKVGKDEYYYYVPYVDGGKIPYSLYKNIIGATKTYANYNENDIVVSDATEEANGDITLLANGEFTITFKGNPYTIKPFEVTNTNYVYYAGRANATDSYQLSYSFKIGETDFVEDNQFVNKGNGEYGLDTEYSGQLKITITKPGAEPQDDISDSVFVNTTLKFTNYIKINYNSGNYDKVAEGDNIGELIRATGVGDLEGQIFGKSYVLGADYPLSDSAPETFEDVDVENNVLTISSIFTNDKTIINSICYTYDNGSDNNELTIGYKTVTLVDGKYVDEITGITYTVNNNKLTISKALDVLGEATINNKTYKVGEEKPTINYQVAYVTGKDSEGYTYWTEYRYKVVERYNRVVVDYNAEGKKVVYLNWVREDGNEDGNWVFDPNSWTITETITDGTTTIYTVEKTDSSGSVTFNVYDGTLTLFGTLKYNGTNIVLIEEESGDTVVLSEQTTENSSWAKLVTLTGEAGNSDIIPDTNSDIEIITTGFDKEEYTIIIIAEENETLKDKVVEFNIVLGFYDEYTLLNNPVSLLFQTWIELDNIPEYVPSAA